MASAKHIGISVKKNENLSDWYTQVIWRAGLADYAPVKGFIVLKPYGYAIWELIKDILDRKLKETGHQNGFLPVLIPEALLAKEKVHFTGFTPEVFWVTRAGNNDLSEKLALRPTSETIAYSSFSRWIASYRDLPIKMNFWNSALRAEIKATKPFIRNSEFLWQEGHTVHTDEEEAKGEVMLILEIYQRLIEDHLAIATIAGLKSEKEKFVGAQYTTTLEGMMPDGKALQMATSHHLGQNFSKPFEIKYLGQDNDQHYAWQTSWGISWRLIGALVMMHGDDKGLLLPPYIAPIQIVIVPIFRDKDSKVVKSKALEVANVLRRSGIRVKVDERDEYTSGWKFNEWEVKGVPLRINLGPRDIENAQVELVRRDTMQKSTVNFSILVDSALAILNEIQSNLLLRTKEILKHHISMAISYDSFKSILDDKGGFIYTGWCGDQSCETKVKEETGADLRVLPFDEQQEAESGLLSKCVYCMRSANKVAVFARAY
ncbi:MAG: proline--tRNA ligase [Candidatus Nitrosopolaris sp.]